MNADSFAWTLATVYGSCVNMIFKKSKRHGQLESGEFDSANGGEATSSALLGCLATALASLIQSLTQSCFKVRVCHDLPYWLGNQDFRC